MNIADLRKSYEKAELSEDASDANPLKQFERWLNEAIQSEVPEPNAMTVATVASNRFQKLTSNRAGRRAVRPITSNRKAIKPMAITK